MVLIYTTCKDTTEAVRLGDLIVKSHAAACVNIWPMQSMYMDGETLKSQTEATLLIKTLESKQQEIEDLILKNHTYAVPFIGAIEVRRVNREYKEWMAGVIR
ncbi:MAG: divalent-cation tolerance protein CutA [Patescibacteria group bacterium]